MISEFALFVFTTLGGLGAGLYAASAVFPVSGKRANVAVPLIALVCLGIGGIALLLHLGHPERMLNAFANPGSGITQEAIVSMVFGLIVVLDLALAFFKGSVPRALRIVGAVAGVVLCCVMGLAYYAYESQAAWHAWSTIPLFLCADLAVGFLLLGAIDEHVAVGKPFMWANVILSVVAAVAFAVTGAQFAGIGLSPQPFIAAVVLAVAAACGSFVADKRVDARMYWPAFGLMFVAVVVARYAFYAVV